MSEPSAKTLNSEQIKAIEYGDGPLLIIAGAGTGKTTVVTERIKFLITQKNISPNNILALTFTEKAAREMEARVDIALPLGYANLWISTFHSFCDRILRDESVNIGLDPSYHLMTQAENIQLVRKNLFEFDLNYFRPLGNPYKFIEGLLQHFSRLKDEDVEPEEYLDWVEKENKKLKIKNKNDREKIKDLDDEDIKRYRELASAYQTYEELKIKEGVMDFGDLMSWTLKLFRTRKNILKSYQEKFKYILVDEFQDTNFAQYVLVKLLAPPPNSNLTVVGDDNQAIYRFRGAAISNILQFKDDYPEAREVILNKNYRSTQATLDSAYKLIKNNDPDTLEAKLGINKKLQKMRKVKEVPVEFLIAERVEQEAEMVVEEIKNEKIKNKNCDWKDFAILVRANNHAEPFIKALSWQGIPNQFLGPGMLFRQPEVKDLIAYLQVLDNFENDVAMYRLLSMDIFNISGRDLAELTNYSRKHHLSLFETGEIVAGIRDASLKISDDSRETLIKVFTTIHRHQDWAKKEGAARILFDFLQETGLWQKLANVRTVEEERKTQNITKFLEKLKGYEAEHEDVSVRAVVDYVDLCLELGESPLVGDTDWTENDAVNILTVHSAKGLEFPVVFLVNLVSQRFPTAERREQIPIPEELIKEVLPVGDYHLEEERRLFYVGMTRARDQLFFTAAKFYGEGKREKKISPFVAEALGDKVTEFSATPGETKRPAESEKNTEEKVAVSVCSDQLPMIILSYSRIETFNLCPLKYKFAYILGLPCLPSAALSFGTTIHETMRDFYQRAIAGQKPTKQDLSKILDENWVSVGYFSKEQREKYKKEGRKILAGFYEKAYDPRVLPVALEQPFSIRLSPWLKIVGKIDRIDQAGDKVEIVDYKTGKPLTSKEAEKSLQLGIYALAVASGQLTTIGVLKTLPKPEEVKVSFYFFEGQEKITVIKTGEDLKKVKEELLFVAEKINQSDFTPNPGLMCNFCEYKMVCDEWK